MALLKVLPLLFLLGACASRPYTMATISDVQKETRIDTICTHKTFVVPWFIGVAAGFVAFNYDKKCWTEVRGINDPRAGDEVIEPPKVDTGRPEK